MVQKNKILTFDVNKPQNEGRVLLKDDVKDFKFKNLPQFIEPELNDEENDKIETLLIYTNKEKDKNNLSEKDYFSKDSNVLKIASLVKIKHITKEDNDEWKITLECVNSVSLTTLYDKNQKITNIAEDVVSVDFEKINDCTITNENNLINNKKTFEFDRTVDDQETDGYSELQLKNEVCLEEANDNITNPDKPLKLDNPFETNELKIYPNSVTKLIKKVKTQNWGMERDKTSAYINTLESLPWRKVEIETLDIKKVSDILDKNHNGLKEAKQRIIEHLALIINERNVANAKKEKSRLLPLDENHQIDLDLFKEEVNGKKVQKNFNNVPILILVGPPGVGKTSLTNAIAEALNKSIVKISLGGVHDELDIRGSSRNYNSAMPGKIIKGIQKVGVSNPIILLDEIDKMGASTQNGDPAAALLEALDPEQNTKFQDSYLEHEYDLSKVMFIATANYIENIPRPLLDRMEVIELSSYTTKEKIKIASDHLVKKIIKKSTLNEDQFIIDNQVIKFIIENYTHEAGVRKLQQLLEKIARKIVTKIVLGENIKKFVITKEIVIELLGAPKIKDEDSDKDEQPTPGVVNGLAWTPVGGTTLQVEVNTLKGKGGLKLTGSLKDVMKESANIALTYVRCNAEAFGIKNFDFDENEIHIHVPEGAVQKDGPSAGVVFATALISALGNKPVPQTVAMTGEITLRGRVLEIGGLKEKLFAAHKKKHKTNLYSI
nr:S16 family serine protease [Mycoplasmopsis iners]